MFETALIEGVISQVAAQVVQSVQRVRLRAQSDVAVGEHVHFEWVDTSEQNPLSDIELSSRHSCALQHQWSFDILLYYSRLNALIASQYISTIILKSNSVASGSRTRFYYPNITTAIGLPLPGLFVREIYVLLDYSLDGRQGGCGVELADEDWNRNGGTLAGRGIGGVVVGWHAGVLL